MGVVDFLRNESEKIWKIIRVYGSYSVDRELVDRMTSLTHIDLFNTDVIIFVDDIHREAEASLLSSLSERLGRPATIFEAKSGAKFGYI
jgi:hypothetical protein